MSSHHLLEMTSTIDGSPESLDYGYLSQNPFQLPIISDRVEKQKDLENVINGVSQGYRMLILIRGLPGSGKSHLGKYIIDATIGGKKYANHILSTDDYFMKNGKYNFDKAKLDEAHNWNQRKALQAMELGVSPVIIDNTNTELWEMIPYATIAVQYNYCVEILEPNTPWKFDVTQLARKNKHGVSKHDLSKMLGRYQKDVTGYSLLCSYNLEYAANKPPMFRNHPPLPYGTGNWYSCNNLTSAVNSQQPEATVQQNWSTYIPQGDKITAATDSVNFMNFNEENSWHASHTPTQSDSQLSQSRHSNNFIHFADQYVKYIDTKGTEDDEFYVNTVDDIRTCIPIDKNNILEPHLVNAGAITTLSKIAKIELEPKACSSTATLSDTTISSDSENYSDSDDSESTEPEEMIELNLGELLVNQLEKKFGNELPGYPKGFDPVVQVPLSLAKQLFAFYLDSVYQQVDDHNRVPNAMTKQDEELATQLDQQERQKFKEHEDTVDDFQAIMDEQVAQEVHQNNASQWKNLSPETLAVKLTKQKLYNSFPSIDQNVIDEILQAHGYNFNQTVEVILNSAPTQVAGSIDDIKKAPITQDIIEEMQRDMDCSPIMVPTCGQTADQYRRAANIYQTKRNELRQKAQRFYQRGMTEVAQFYSELATKQTSNLERANNWAATSFLKEHAKRLKNLYYVDLHGLYIREAKPAVDVFIDENIHLLRESGKTYQDLYIITGRGKNSENGKPKIKPVVINKLKKRKISYVHVNPGCLMIKITRNTRMTSDVR